MAFTGLSGTPSRMIARHGERFTLRRSAAAPGANSYTQGATTISYHAARGRMRAYRPSEIKGGILERDSLIVLDPASCDVAPVAGDRIAAGNLAADGSALWLQLVNVYPVRVGGAVAAYRLQVRA